jgi:hypothetical protein
MNNLGSFQAKGDIGQIERIQRSVWHPYTIKHIDIIENVQRRVTKQLPGFMELSYSERVEKLKLPTLSFSRRVASSSLEL